MNATAHGQSAAQLRLDMQLSTAHLWEHVFSRANLSKALKRVEQNAGAPGVDDMTTEQLRPWLYEHWQEVKAELDAGTYKPKAVCQVMIPKSGGGQRKLGVPTVLDRLIQQAMSQMLTPIFDPTFSESSFGFRPKRSAQQAAFAAKSHIETGGWWVIDVDLDNFFDRVNHDILMARVSAKVNDKRVLRLIGKYLRAGVMSNGIIQPKELGTPQGSPLSPLLSNVLLDDLDKELENRGHKFVRYADDVRVFVKSKRAAQRVLDGMTSFIETKLKLKVNKQKSKVSPLSKATLLGFRFYRRKGQLHIGVAKSAWTEFRHRIRRITSRRWGISMELRIGVLNKFIRGWMAYFNIAFIPTTFKDEDQWIRRRLRNVQWKQWKKWSARRKGLRALGASDENARAWASSDIGYWRVSGSRLVTSALSNKHWKKAGLVGLHDNWSQLNRAV
jgi:RNA-directed DNA polymerase